MANTLGQKSGVDDSAWKNNKEMNPQENSSVTNESTNDRDGMFDSAWRPADNPLESPTSSEFDDAEAQKRNENIKTDSPGLDPHIAD